MPVIEAEAVISLTIIATYSYSSIMHIFTNFPHGGGLDVRIFVIACVSVNVKILNLHLLI